MSLVLESEASAKFPINPAGGGRDHKAWAKRILYRFDKGDKDLLQLQIQFAQMAMGLLEMGGARE
jgi:hypothetical protein